MVCLLTASCALQQDRKDSHRSSVPLELARVLVFPDVPTPEGFALVGKEVRGRGQNRVALLIYEGGAPLAELEAFFRQQMAVGDWHEKKRHELLAERILSYRKGPEHCVVSMRRTGDRVRVELRLNNY